MSVQNANPKVTVLMPVYNAERHLRDAIDSILAQSFTDFELLIINDGSTDGSVEIIESFSDPRIRLVHNDRNLGLVLTLNKGIDLARGNYVARMDSDDISLPNRLEQQVALLDADSSLSVVAVKVALIDELGREIGSWSSDKYGTETHEICRHLPLVCCIAHPSIMARKNVLSSYRYDPAWKNIEDYNLWLRLCADGHLIGKIDKPLLKLRIHEGQITQTDRQLRSGLLDIKLKAYFLLNRIAHLKLSGFEGRVFIGLLRDLTLLFLKPVLKLVRK